MALKKSDKLIAIIGVIILIVAAIAVIFYTQEEDEPTTSNQDEKSYYLYPVESEIYDMEVEPDNTNFMVAEKLIGDGSYSGVVEIPASNLKDVKFFIEYSDKVTGFLLSLIKNIGADTITLTVETEDGMVLDTVSITGSGNETITTPDKSAHFFDDIKAESPQEAEQKLQENLSEMSNLGMIKYNIKVSLNQKESILNIISWLREKLFDSDPFTLTITYEYYDYYIGEPSEPPDPPIEENFSGYTNWKSTPYNSCSTTGFH